MFAVCIRNIFSQLKKTGHCVFFRGLICKIAPRHDISRNRRAAEKQFPSVAIDNAIMQEDRSAHLFESEARKNRAAARNEVPSI